MITKQAILIDLDSLLDTRIATISKINQRAAVKLITMDAYYNRHLNDFKDMCGIPKAVFDSHFDRRDVSTLKASLPTGIIFALRTMIDDLAEQRKSTPFVESVRVTVNCHPYKLGDEEKAGLSEVVGAYTGLGKERIDIVNLPYEVLTPQHIKDRFTGCILYNFREWMECQADAFLQTRMPEIVVLAPALFREREPAVGEVTLEGGEHLSTFDIAEGGLVGCFDLNFLDMMYFSIIPPQELARSANPA